MKPKSRRRLGIFLMTISVVFLIAALYTLFFFVDGGNYAEAPALSHDPSAMVTSPRRLPEAYNGPTQDLMSGPSVAVPTTYKWPLRWLTQPLAIFGIFLFISGLLLGYHDDISQIF